MVLDGKHRAAAVGSAAVGWQRRAGGEVCASARGGEIRPKREKGATNG